MKQAKNSEDDSLRRYVELMYSEGSELNKVENLEERKQLACKMAGLDPISPFVKSMMEMTNPKTNVQIINYLNKNNTNLYVKLMSDQQLFYNLQRIIMDSEKVDLDLWMKISEKSEDLVKRIEELKFKIYKQPEVMAIADKQIRMITPEQRLREKKEINSQGSPSDQTLASA